METPDLTLAQKLAALIAGVPIVSNLLRAFGVWDASPDQEQALGEAIDWSVGFAGLLVGADLLLRRSRAKFALASRDFESSVVDPSVLGVDPGVGDGPDPVAPPGLAGE